MARHRDGAHNVRHAGTSGSCFKDMELVPLHMAPPGWPQVLHSSPPLPPILLLFPFLLLFQFYSTPRDLAFIILINDGSLPQPCGLAAASISSLGWLVSPLLFFFPFAFYFPLENS